MAAATLALLLVTLAALHGAAPVLAVAGDPPFSCGPSSAEASEGLAFCDVTLAPAQRAADLVSRLTAAEKIAQLGDQAPGVPRLGVPGYKWWNEALHGLATSGKGLHFDAAVRAATSFPQVLLTAAAFDDDLWLRIGQAIGREARALFNVGQAEGLTIWSPNVNIFRDPRWGRGQETPGEDPAVASRYAVAFVRGIQGNSSSSLLQTSACCKHATAYDLEDWNGVARYSFVARVTEQDLEDTFNPPFRSCVVEAKASCVMCAYTAINGVPACANSDLLTGTVRGDWGLDGYVASDCDAVAIMRDAQRYAPTPEDAVAVSLKAGLDIDCGSYVQQHAAAAIQQGKLTEQDIDKALTNLYAVRMRLGHFDGDPRKNMYGVLGAADICTPEHRNLALEAAQDGIVLLKNDGGILPLDRSTVTSAAVIGPNANDGMALIANYFGPPCESTTPLKGLQSYVNDVRFLAGCNSAACDVAATDQAVALAGSEDYVFLFMGLSQKQESEGKDRTSLLLPGMQQSLITAVADASKRPVILVLLSGGPVDITFAQSNPKIGAILWAGYPGQAGGLAIAKVLFGDHNPSGRLPVTWYPEEFTKVPMTDMRMRADPTSGYPGRSYRFYQGNTVYKFGYGLSYSTFSRRLVHGTSVPALSSTLLTGLRETMTPQDGDRSYHVDAIGTEGCEQLKFPAMVEVQNHGPMDGKHSVLMFLRWPNTKQGRPASQLIGFRSQHLKAGETAKLRFDISPCKHFSRVRADGRKVIDIGSHFLMVDNHEMEIRFEP
ncbi:putative O-Glycosyl hydrolase superfamily protein precursor [Zea mays]|uniref:Putative O-Glycosyl hydrolase superfamily protein n=1 Tax=Zea mays TaxID=4577 RepID=K7V329_MAIZE|nr:putative O-Glycosyl hydrolase superfamily protein precursor [Zea mays]AQK58066.1 Putative O-Glycosyl hydrolase superfamily protein [Zea mays]|eukprot:NP_001307635.1 putative O-Glycosyl hydrolase superfamily protein precursor [Zea mays]